MKRLTRTLIGAFFATLTVLTAFISSVNAAWRYDGMTGDNLVYWRHYGAGALGFSEQFATSTTGKYSDTLYVSAAPARVDTTTEWTMLNVDNLPLQTYGGTAVDTLAAAVFIIQADSTVASSVNFKNTTVKFQVNYGSRSTGWQDTYTVSVLPTDGLKTLYAPIYSRLAAIDRDIGNDFLVPGVTFAPRMRALVTWGTSAAVPSARIFIKKYVAPCSQ